MMTAPASLIVANELKAQLIAQGVQLEILAKQNSSMRVLMEELMLLCLMGGVSQETLDKFREAIQ